MSGLYYTYSLLTNHCSLSINFCYCHIRTAFCAHCASYALSFWIIKFDHIISKSVGFAAFFNQSLRTCSRANVAGFATIVIYYYFPHIRLLSSPVLYHERIYSVLFVTICNKFVYNALLIFEMWN